MKWIDQWNEKLWKQNELTSAAFLYFSLFSTSGAMYVGEPTPFVNVMFVISRLTFRLDPKSVSFPLTSAPRQARRQGRCPA